MFLCAYRPPSNLWDANIYLYGETIQEGTGGGLSPRISSVDDSGARFSLLRCVSVGRPGRRGPPAVRSWRSWRCAQHRAELAQVRVRPSREPTPSPWAVEASNRSP